MPKTFRKDTIFIVGDSKTAVNNPITVQYSAYFLAFVIDEQSGVIIDAGASTTISLTNDFVKSIFIGYHMDSGVEPMIEEITRRYHGTSQKAMVVAWKDAYKKYEQIKGTDTQTPLSE